MANFASTLFTKSEPEIALKFNPFNYDARSGLLYRDLIRTDITANVPALANIAETGVTLEPYSSRFHTLLGVTHQVQGNEEHAQNLFMHALEVNPVEFQALLRRFSAILESGDPEEVMSVMERLIRAWPRHNEVLAPYYLSQLSKDEVRKLVVARLSMFGGKLVNLLNHIHSLPGGTEIIMKMVREWHDETGGIPDLRVRDQVVNSLIRSGRMELAHAYFRSVLRPEEVDVAGYIFDSDFKLSPRYSPFYWRLPKTKGIYSEFSEYLDRNGDTKSSISVNFSGTPVRLNNTLLYTRFDPGPFNLSVTYQTRNFKGPAPLSIMARCNGNAGVLGELQLETTNGKTTTSSVAFEVPNTGCSMVRLVIASKFLPNTWNNRYEGGLRLDSIVALRATGS